MSTPTLYTIKRLRWKRDEVGDYIADTVIGPYFVAADMGDGYEAITPDNDEVIYPTIKAAKQWAQEHFEERMKQGLKEHKG